MRNRLFLTALAAICLLGSAAISQTTAFNYQGKLSDLGNPANGVYQMRFALYDAPVGGNQIGVNFEDTAVSVAQGVFNVRLDFGATVFSGADRFLEISVRRNAGENYVTLNVREQIASSPYSIRTLSAAQADVALDSQKLGGIDAVEYVTNATVGSSFIRNGTTLQTGSFNISGNGFLNGNLGIGTTNPLSRFQVFGNGYGMTQTNGAVTVGSFLTAGSGWFGTRSNHPLNFFTNDGGAAMQITTTGDVGVGNTPSGGFKFDVSGNGRYQTANGDINLGTPNGETGITFLTANRADFRFGNTGLKIVAGSGTGVPPGTNGIFISHGGNVAIGRESALFTAKLLVEGTGASINSASINTQATTPGGFALAAFGRTYATGHMSQTPDANGTVKGMIEVDRSGTILRCYNSQTGATTGGCGFVVTLPLGNVGVYNINFGFSVTDRFFAITPRYATTCNVVPIQCRNAGVNYGVNGSNLEVFTFNADNAADTAEASFMVIVF